MDLVQPKDDVLVGVHKHSRIDRSEADTAARKVTLVGAFTNLILTVVKAIAGIFGHSAALIADAIHSASDLLSDVVVWVAVLFGSREADDNHPYGHRRFETMATLAVSILIILTAVFIIYKGIVRMDAGQIETPLRMAMFVAAIAILMKEWLYHLTIKVGRKYDLSLIISNAHHHRSDAFSSIAALIGIIGTMLGHSYLDLVAAIVIGVMLLRVGIGLAWQALLEISDIGVDEETAKIIENLIISEDDVVALHLLKTRHLGGEILCEVHIQVPPRITVTAGHQMAERVRLAIMNNVPKVAEVTVHVDPEDDEEGTIILPRRQHLMRELDLIITEFPMVHLVSEPLLHMMFGGCEVVIAPLIEGELDEVNDTAHRLEEAIIAHESFVKATVHLRLERNDSDSESEPSSDVERVEDS